MIYEKISLFDEFPELRNSVTDCEPTLTAYLPSNTHEISTNLKRPTIIVCPGGGYGFVSDREGEPVALNFVGDNYNAFVLKYSVAPARYPQALLELAATITYVRRNSEKYNVDTARISVCGFSAGGHLVASYGTLWDEQFIKDKLGISASENKPNSMILAYPVITSGEKAHRDSFNNLLGDDAENKEMLNLMSVEKQINSKTPPAFIWHTFNDNTVPVENSIMLAVALREQNIPFELHIFPDGPHGMSLSSKVTSLDPNCVNQHVGSWVKLCKEWLQAL